MRANHVKEKLQSGGVSLGTFVFEFSTSGIARIAAEAGAEFAIFDMEHTGWSVETIRRLVASAGSLVPLVRVPAAEYHFLARVLDVGALGIMVPMVESAGQARQIVASCKYPPDGRRGAAFTIAHDDYAGGDIVEKMRSANSQQLLIAQIETATGLSNVGEIAAVDGVDILWVGQFDLTNSMGIPGQFEHPEFTAALATVVAAADANQKVSGMFVMSVDEATLRLEQGFRAIAYGGDLWIYQSALKQALNQISGWSGASDG